MASLVLSVGYQSCHFGNGVRSITVGKDECHVMELLHRKIFDILVHLGDIDIDALDGAYVRFSNRSGEESQLQAEPDQDNCHNSDSVMHAHNGPPTFAAGMSRHIARVTPVEACRRRRPRQSGVTEALFFFEGP
jgi:hypothetical protein